MRAWIGNLAAYNNGSLVGEWVDLFPDADAMGAHIARICGDVEHYVADYDAVPNALTKMLGEYAGAQALADAATLIDAMRDACPDAVDVDDMLDAFLDCAGYGKSLADLADEAEEWVSDHFAGVFDTLTHFAEDILAENDALAAIPENLRNYFDFEAYGRDMELGGDVFTRRASAGLLVFWNH